MHALRKGQAESFYFEHLLGEIRLVSRVFEKIRPVSNTKGCLIMVFATVPDNALAESINGLFKAVHLVRRK